MDVFSRCRVSQLALMKMTSHAVSGGSIEVMGIMIGEANEAEGSIIVRDSFSLPVEGTETRVNAHEGSYEYMCKYLSRDPFTAAVGWYHSHPGYGCWLSAIDIQTQEMNQRFQDPWVAIVIDPKKTLGQGKVDIGAFRTDKSEDRYHSLEVVVQDCSRFLGEMLAHKTEPNAHIHAMFPRK